MKIFKLFLMGTLAAAALVSCTRGGDLPVPEAQLEECVYLGDKTEFSVWAPDAEAGKITVGNNIVIIGGGEVGLEAAYEYYLHIFVSVGQSVFACAEEE